MKQPFHQKYSAPLILLAGDLLAMILFIFFGQREHELINAANPIWGVLYSSAIFALPWAIAGWLLGAFPRADSLTARSLLTRSLNTWLVAAPLGLLLRSYALGRAVVPTAFITAALAFGGLFVLGWRIAFVVIWSLIARRNRAP